VDIVGQVADGLQAAHERGVVHRDVKPGNVLVARQGERERAYLTDFGLTIDPSSAKHLTATGFAIGTAAFMAPEQARGEAVDGRSDVYALACVLFRTLTGMLPYERTSELDMLMAHGHEPPPRLRDVAPELPGELDMLLARAREGPRRSPRFRRGVRPRRVRRSAIASPGPAATAGAWPLSGVRWFA
jgi:serine/threonine protein kinase